MRKAILLVGLLLAGTGIGAECPGPARLEEALAYRQERGDQGLAEPDALWIETEAAQRAEHERQREAGKLKA